MVTLHHYILRELLKVFLLALTALTALFTMGGGLYNVLRYEGVTSTDVLRVMPMLIPVVVTLIMPISALFAVTMVYGRLAADNELQACRAAGINIHRLFLSGMLLALFVVGFTLLFGNYIIPDLMRRIERFARANLRDIVATQLLNKGHIRKGNTLFVTAERVEYPSEQALARQGLPIDGFSYLRIRQATFLELEDDGRPRRFSSAKDAVVQFDTRGTPIKVTGFADQARDFEIGKRTVNVAEQKIGPFPIPLPLPEKESWADLNTLIHWRSRPAEFPELATKFQIFRLETGRVLLLNEAAALIAAGKPVVLTGKDGVKFTLSAQAAAPDGRGLKLTNVKVDVAGTDAARLVGYQAGKGEFSAKPLASGDLLIDVRLEKTADQPVRETRSRAGEARRVTEKPSLNLDPLEVPLPAQAAALTPANVLDSSFPLPPGRDLEDNRYKYQRETAEFVRKVTSLIHFRLGFCSSTLVTIIMGAALGIIFRGARALLAIALACVPFFSLLIVMMMGRQLGDHENTQHVGPILIWGGMGALALVDAFMLWIGVRR